jgi:hypothetical protein
MVVHVKDRTGRFAERPHYSEMELDSECEQIISDFLRELHGTVNYPVTTDDLTKLIESRTADLDLYSDLSGAGEDVEGLTEFIPGQKPRVRISRLLSEDPRQGNRFRTTLTHEFGHVHFHNYLWDASVRQSNLFATGQHSGQPMTCKRETIVAANKTDWMEWQAGYACGAILMPITAVKRLVADIFNSHGIYATVTSDSVHGRKLIASIVEAFHVSEEAATVRLSRLNFLSTTAPTQALWQ